MQFRIRNLLFVTFVVALCGGLISLSPPVGCVAAVPISIATIRTLRRGSPATGKQKNRSLWLTFLQSLVLLVALLIVSLLCGAAALWALGFWSARLLGALALRTARLVKMVLLRLRADRGVRSLQHAVMRGTSWLLGGTSAATDVAVRFLNRTNRSLYTHWAS